MLVLSRHLGERIIIGEHPNLITITLIDIRGDKVRIGVDAPKHVAVNREEIYKIIREEKVEDQERAKHRKEEEGEGRRYP
jgi:carbon storage regulator